MAKRIIAVTGATGIQGGSVARILLETGEWQVRAITRNPSSDAAKALAATGVEVVAADMDDEESLVRAFEGAHAIFAVTNFWEHLFRGSSQRESGDKELLQGQNLARAASKTSSLEHYVWSTLISASKATDGKCGCAHLDYKAKVDDFIRADLPDLAAKTTYYIITSYASNMAFFPMCKPFALPGSDKYIYPQPCAGSVQMELAGDMRVNPGICVRQILLHSDKTKGKYVLLATDVMRMDDSLKVWSEVTGKEAIYVEISVDAYTAMWGIPGAELADQYKMMTVAADWQKLIKGDLVSNDEIGISKDTVGFKAALENLKSFLL